MGSSNTTPWPPMGFSGGGWWCIPWISHLSCCCFQYRQLQKMSLPRAIGNMKAAKTIRSPEKCSKTPRLLKRYLEREGIKVLSKMNGEENYLEILFFYFRQIWPKKLKSQVLKKKKKYWIGELLCFSLWCKCMAPSIWKKQNPFFLCPPNGQHLQMSYRSHFWKANYSPWFISSVTPQIVTKNRWSSQLVLPLSRINNNKNNSNI